MNAERRKQLTEAISHVEEAKSIIETAATEERDEYEASPRKLKKPKKASPSKPAPQPSTRL